jgi:hypothetical protein
VALMLSIDDIQIGDVFFRGSFTDAGNPNFIVVCGFGPKIKAPRQGIYVHFVDPDNFRDRRDPSDRDFYIWDHDFEGLTPAGTFYAPDDPLELRHRTS